MNCELLTNLGINSIVILNRAVVNYDSSVVYLQVGVVKTPVVEEYQVLALSP